jgi:CelD/BcsL family acetyltransferase involved in cellulose biosynthesis
LSELGNLTFEVVVDPILYKSYMKILIEQKRERFKSTSVPDALSKQNIREFYYNINDNKSLKKNSHLSVLKLNDEIIACHWGLVNEKNFYYLMPSFNIKFANYSPGKILIYNLLIWSIENDFKIFDFTIGSEDYKKEWSDNEMILHQYIQHKSLLGFYAKIYFKLIDYVKNNKPLWNFLRKIYRNIN